MYTPSRAGLVKSRIVEHSAPANLQAVQPPSAGWGNFLVDAVPSDGEYPIHLESVTAHDEFAQEQFAQGSGVNLTLSPEKHFYHGILLKPEDNPKAPHAISLSGTVRACVGFTGAQNYGSLRVFPFWSVYDESGLSPAVREPRCLMYPPQQLPMDFYHSSFALDVNGGSNGQQIMASFNTVIYRRQTNNSVNKDDPIVVGWAFQSCGRTLVFHSLRGFQGTLEAHVFKHLVETFDPVR